MIKVCLAQINSTLAEKSTNLAKIVDKAKKAKEKNADIIVFPELSLTGYDKSLSSLKDLAEPVPGPSTRKLQKLAREKTFAIVIGLVESDGERFFNTAVYIDKIRIKKYRKTHVHWTEPFSPGNLFPIIETSVGKVGILICYDLSFPESARVLALRGAQILICPSSVPADFSKYAEKRAITRALDNQLYLLYCNTCGNDFSGNSLIINPKGEIIARGGKEEALIFASIDRQIIKRWRVEEKIFSRRRPELYAEIVKTKFCKGAPKCSPRKKK